MDEAKEGQVQQEGRSASCVPVQWSITHTQSNGLLMQQPGAVSEASGAEQKLPDTGGHAVHAHV